MRVYHGSYVEVAEPDIIHSRKKIDFGVGFYVTPIEEQAKNWCKLKGAIHYEGKSNLVTHEICEDYSAFCGESQH